jgi:uncharacterized protein YxjI
LLKKSTILLLKDNYAIEKENKTILIIKRDLIAKEENKHSYYQLEAKLLDNFNIIAKEFKIPN